MSCNREIINSDPEMRPKREAEVMSNSCEQTEQNLSVLFSWWKKPSHWRPLTDSPIGRCCRNDAAPVP